MALLFFVFRFVTSSIQTQLNGKAASSHTHNYAGSSSAGGAANSANKLNTNAGSSTQPVYFSEGKPVAATDYSNAYVRGLKFVDTRDTNPNPSSYDVGIQADFKEREAVGVTSIGSPYEGLVTLKPYRNSSGSATYQIYLAYDSGMQVRPRLFLRSGETSGDWGVWRELFTTYICRPDSLVVKRNGSYVQEFSTNALTGSVFSEFYASSTVLACNGDRSACTDAITATTKVSSSGYRLVFDAASSNNMRINLICFMF